MIEIKHKETGEVLHTVKTNTLKGANLSSVNLADADLSGANLNNTILNNANLAYAKMSNAFMISAKLSNANLSNANLNNADLRSATLTKADLTNTDLIGAAISGTNFTNCVTLHLAKGLELVDHLGASFLDASTLRACVNHLPDEFLQDVGYNQQEIDYLRSMYAGGVMGGGIRYYSCFLSYAHSDNAFVKRLRTDLISNGVNCWKDDDLQTGTKWKEEIDKAIRGHEKLVLVCSRRSL